MPRTLLIANRGEIACRIARTARAMGIRTVAVYSDPDADAAHVAAADEAVALRGAAARDSYLRGDLLIDAAVRAGADAVHPGYGFLSEDAGFAAACADAGLVFVGPSPEAIAAMGDKLAAKERFAALGVPVLPSWAPADVPPDAYPVLVKAAAGGGGKGMRVVDRPEDLAEAVAAAQREAAAAFGDDRVFVERYLRRPRHVEVQVLGDLHGALVALGERDCSLQRRHQKVVEESPAPGVSPELRERLVEAALTAARALRYSSAGTVEFVLDDGGDPWFLEVNTRLQVEHPVTELAWRLRDGTALDLVRLQLLVADGQALPFGQNDVDRAGHAVEARLYAEDPAAGWLPSPGRLTVFDVPALPERGVAGAARVRVDAGVRAGDTVSVHYDPLLAKVIAAAPTRAEAAALLALTLAGARIHGVRTNRDVLVRALRHPAFVAGDVTTAFFDEHGLSAEEPPDPEAVRLHAVAATLAGARRRALVRTVQRTVPPGWRNNPSAPQSGSWRVGDATVVVSYAPRRAGGWDAAVDGASVDVVVHAWPDERGDDGLDLALDGRRCVVRLVAGDGDQVHVDSPLGAQTLVEVPRFVAPGADEAAGGLRAPMPGTVVAVAATQGAEVRAGDLLVVLEAMKMEHRVTAPEDGVVSSVSVAVGERVAAGDVLVVLEPAQYS